MQMGQGSGGFRGFSQPDVSMAAFRVTRAGQVNPLGQVLVPAGNAAAPGLAFGGGASGASGTGLSFQPSSAIDFFSNTQCLMEIQRSSARVVWLDVTTSLCWGTSTAGNGSRDLFLLRDTTGALGQRDGTNAQTFRLYNTFTSTTNFERLGVQWTTNVCQVWTEKGSGGGTARDMVLGADATEVMRFTSADCKLATAKTLSIASGTNQRAGNAVLVGGTVTVANTTVTANTIVMLTRKTSGGTIGTAITYTVSAATSFTITSDNILDTSTFSYLLIEVP